MVALLASACTEQELSDVRPFASLISFRSDMGESPTRATDLQFEDGDSISVVAFLKADAFGGSAYDEGKYICADGFFSATTEADQIVATENKDSLAYRAVYPYVKGAPTGKSFTFSVQSDQSQPNAYTASDLMTAVTEATDEFVPTLRFRHRLSKLLFKVTSEEGVSVSNLSISMVNAFSQAEMDFEADTCYALKTERATVVAASDGTNRYKMLLPPQNLSATNQISLTVTSPDLSLLAPPSFDLPVALKSGYQTTFELLIKKDLSIELKVL